MALHGAVISRTLRKFILAPKHNNAQRVRKIQPRILDYGGTNSSSEDEDTEADTSGDEPPRSANTTADALQGLLAKVANAVPLGHRVLKLKQDGEVRVIKWNVLHAWQREKAILDKLRHHPAVIQPLAKWKANNLGFLSFPFVQDQPLACASGPWFDFAEQLLHAVSVLHEIPVYHGDIKRENIIWTAASRLFLIDFDAAGTLLFSDRRGTSRAFNSLQVTIALQRSLWGTVYRRLVQGMSSPLV